MYGYATPDTQIPGTRCHMTGNRCLLAAITSVGSVPENPIVPQTYSLMSVSPAPPEILDLKIVQAPVV